MKNLCIGEDVTRQGCKSGCTVLRHVLQRDAGSQDHREDANHIQTVSVLLLGYRFPLTEMSWSGGGAVVPMCPSNPQARPLPRPSSVSLSFITPLSPSKLSDALGRTFFLQGKFFMMSGSSSHQTEGVSIALKTAGPPANIWLCALLFSRDGR